MEWLKSRNAIAILCLLFIFIIAIPKVLFPDLSHGDEYSDANILNAGKNFVKFGFIRCRFLGFYEPNLDKPLNPYIHAPDLSSVINGGLRKIFKTDSLRFFRIFSLLFSLLNLFFWYWFVKRITRSNAISFLAAIFYFTNPFFIYGADAIYQNAFSDFLRALIFFCCIKMLDSSHREKISLLFIWILVVLETCITFEYIIYLSLFFILLSAFYPQAKIKLSKKHILILLSAPVFGFLLHFLQNVWYFGSFNLAFQDLKNIALERMMHSSDAPPLNLYIWLRYVLARNFSLVFIFNWFTLFILTFFSCILYQPLSAKVKEEVNSLLRFFFLFCLCGISWYIIFPSHSWAHAFILFLVRHLLPAAAIGFTIFSYITLSFIKENLRLNFYTKAFTIFIIIFILLSGIRESQLPFTPEKVRREQEFVKFKDCLLHLRNISQEKDIIGVNYFRYPFMRYYADRSFRVALNTNSLADLPNLPKYFVLILQDNPNTYELFNFINQRYSTLFECNSALFPSIFFELKQ
jgi:hypothetical protein